MKAAEETAGSLRRMEKPREFSTAGVRQAARVRRCKVSPVMAVHHIGLLPLTTQRGALVRPFPLIHVRSLRR